MSSAATRPFSPPSRSCEYSIRFRTARRLAPPLAHLLLGQRCCSQPRRAHRGLAPKARAGGSRNRSLRRSRGWRQRSRRSSRAASAISWGCFFWLSSSTFERGNRRGGAKRCEPEARFVCRRCMSLWLRRDQDGPGKGDQHTARRAGGCERHKRRYHPSASFPLVFAAMGGADERSRWVGSRRIDV